MDVTEDSPVQVEEKHFYPKYTKFSYKWPLSAKDIRCDMQLPYILTSKTFSAGNGSSWCLKFKSSATSRHRNPRIPICLTLECHLLSFDRPKISGKFTFFGYAAGGSQKISVSKEATFEWGPSENKIVFPDVINENELLRTFPLYPTNDCQTIGFTILCDIIITDLEPVNHPENYSIAPFNVSGCELQENLSLLFETQAFSDVTFTICGQELSAHKAILAMRSRVFWAMFDREMEKTENKVEVTVVDYETFREMLRFVYTGRVPHIDKMAGKLLAAANKYELERLKDMCEETLRSNLAIDNAVDVLIIADRSNAEKLKSRTAQFIYVNREKVLDTDGFRSMSTSHPSLVVEILRASVAKKNEDDDNVHDYGDYKEEEDEEEEEQEE